MEQRRTSLIYLIVGLYVILVALMSIHCVRITDTTRQEQITQPDVTPSSTPAPNPSGNAPPVATVRIGEFAGREGINCGAAPEILIGCKALVTCTPRDSAGNDLGSKYIPQWSTIGSLIFNQISTNFYNGRIECDSAGQGVVACEVGGVIGSYQLTCVTAP